MKKDGKAKIFLKGLFIENPLFVMLLGTCPALATTKSLESALGMGLLFLIVLVCSNALISSIRKLVPDEIRIPCYIVVIATFVTIVKLITEAYLPDLYSTLGVFISLIVVNCIVLGRAEAFASKNTVVDSILDGLGMGLGYTIALLIIAFFREFIGTGGFSIGYVFPIPGGPYVWTPLQDYALKFFTMPGGAFLVLGIILGSLAAISNHKANKKKAQEKAAKEKQLLEAQAAPSKEVNNG